MAAKKNTSKRASSKKASPKKATGKAIFKTKTSKKVTPPKVTPVKAKAPEPLPKEVTPEKEILAQDTEVGILNTGDCVCKQKRPNGKFYCYRLIQGRWVQSSGIPFPTKEACEDAFC